MSLILGVVVGAGSARAATYLPLSDADLARQAGHDVASYADAAEGEMGRVGPGRMAIVRIVLRPRIVFAGAAPDAEELARLHHEAHERCFIANSLRAEIVVEPPLADEDPDSRSLG